MWRFVLVVLLVSLVVPAMAVETDLSNSFSLQTKGQAEAMPDIANLSFTLVGNGDSMAKAQEKLTQTEQAMVSAVQKLGIKKDDLKTESIIAKPLQPERALPYAQPGPTSAPGSETPKPTFQVQQTYSISIPVSSSSDVNRILQIGDTLREQGAQRSRDYGEYLSPGFYYSFGVKAPEKLYQQALSNAITRAYDLANGVAKQLGEGKPQKVKIEVTDNPNTGYSWAYSQEWKPITATANINVTFSFD